jgi:small subunit ribosomal protein S15
MFLRRCAVSAVRRGALLPRATAARAPTVLPLYAPRVLATRRSLSLLAGESPPPSTARPPEVASLENTYIMGIEPELLEGQPEMVRRMFMLLNGRRKDLTKAQKRDAVLRHRQFVDDTGSPEVQAAVLSRGIHAMSAHLSANKKDNNCKRILTRLIHRRRKVLQHLYRLSPKRYFQVSHPHRSSPRQYGNGRPPCAPLPLLVRARWVQSSEPFPRLSRYVDCDPCRPWRIWGFGRPSPRHRSRRTIRSLTYTGAATPVIWQAGVPSLD